MRRCSTCVRPRPGKARARTPSPRAVPPRSIQRCRLALRHQGHSVLCSTTGRCWTLKDAHSRAAGRGHAGTGRARGGIYGHARGGIYGHGAPWSLNDLGHSMIVVNAISSSNAIKRARHLGAALPPLVPAAPPRPSSCPGRPVGGRASALLRAQHLHSLDALAPLAIRSLVPCPRSISRDPFPPSAFSGIT